MDSLTYKWYNRITELILKQSGSAPWLFLVLGGVQMEKKIALLQMDVKLGDIKANYEHVSELLDQAIAGTWSEKPDIIVLPETWNTGFLAKPEVKEISDLNGEKTKALLSNFSRRYEVNIVGGSVSVMENDKLYNRMYVFDRTGQLVSQYDKIHGFSPARENIIYTGGKGINIFELDGVKCSAAICYDIRFPELIRTATLQGVDLFFLPAQWPSIRVKPWLTINTARAMENQMFLCAVNGCGVDGHLQYAGHSLLLDPQGNEIVHLGSVEEIKKGIVNLDTLKDIRQKMNVFEDRREECYHL